MNNEITEHIFFLCSKNNLSFALLNCLHCISALQICLSSNHLGSELTESATKSSCCNAKKSYVINLQRCTKDWTRYAHTLNSKEIDKWLTDPGCMKLTTCESILLYEQYWSGQVKVNIQKREDKHSAENKKFFGCWWAWAQRLLMRTIQIRRTLQEGAKTVVSLRLHSKEGKCSPSVWKYACTGKYQNT